MIAQQQEFEALAAQNKQRKKESKKTKKEEKLAKSANQKLQASSNYQIQSMAKSAKEQGIVEENKNKQTPFIDDYFKSSNKKATSGQLREHA